MHYVTALTSRVKLRLTLRQRLQLLWRGEITVGVVITESADADLVATWAVEWDELPEATVETPGVLQ